MSVLLAPGQGPPGDPAGPAPPRSSADLWAASTRGRSALWGPAAHLSRPAWASRVPAEHHRSGQERLASRGSRSGGTGGGRAAEQTGAWFCAREETGRKRETRGRSPGPPDGREREPPLASARRSRRGSPETTGPQGPLPGRRAPRALFLPRRGPRPAAFPRSAQQPADRGRGRGVWGA